MLKVTKIVYLLTLLYLQGIKSFFGYLEASQVPRINTPRRGFMQAEPEAPLSPRELKLQKPYIRGPLENLEMTTPLGHMEQEEWEW